MNKKIAGLGLPVFFIQPLVGFCLSLYNIRSRVSGIVYVLFAMVIGYAISFSNTSADSLRYAEAFMRFDNTLDYNALVRLYREGELRDLYRLLLFYFVSIFSSNPKVMYAFAGLVYGVFSYLSLRVLVKERGSNSDTYLFFLSLIFFTYYVSLVNVNGFRFNTGALVLFYSLYNFIFQKKSIWVIGILITPLFHYGFLPVIPIFILYKLVHQFFYNKIGVKPLLYYVFVITFLASWFLETNLIKIGFLSQMDIFSGAIGNRMEFLNSSEVANLVDSRKDNSLYLNVKTYFDYGIKIWVFVMVLFIRKLLKKSVGDKSEFTKLFAFVIFFYCLSFVLSTIPSGARFLGIAHLFMILLLVKIYTVYKEVNIKRLIGWSLPVFSFNILFINVLLPILILTPTFWYGNLFWIIIEGMDFYLY
ncbi:EpsG family protein [Planktosalinus lacus]|uniref:EpsG family protein n=1 Tax=Planktosalinus lacus TaxID=1526573 RepID=A0A8J2YB85_9FLAO|nr:EpsG family protein [Planktosalinus lacus]GGE00573.1 hypothetical protein GCM10011312_25060 [Planktosalinus lacus]